MSDATEAPAAAPKLVYHLLNVFARERGAFTGNPLCVFEDGRHLDAQQMQALARQFNLSETTFILPSSRATAQVRIFTPGFEMPFAGHPTLGTAHIVRRLAGAGRRFEGHGKDLDPQFNRLTLAMPAGIIPVEARGDLWTLRANAATTVETGVTRAAMARALGLSAADLLWRRGAPRPLWVDTGSQQLIVPLANPDAVRRAAPVAAELARVCAGRRQMVHVFAEAGDGVVQCRFLFEDDGALREDPATGSACANLGGWYLATGAAPPLVRRVLQGEQVQRPSTLLLSIDAERVVRVGGEVVYLGRGELELPSPAGHG